MNRTHDLAELLATIAAMCAIVTASRTVADYIILPIFYGIYK